MNEKTGNQEPSGATNALPQEMEAVELPPVPPQWAQLAKPVEAASPMTPAMSAEAEPLQAEVMAQAARVQAAEEELKQAQTNQSQQTSTKKKRNMIARVILTLLLLAVVVVSIVMIIWQPWDQAMETAGDPQGMRQDSEPIPATQTGESSEAAEPIEVVEPADPNLQGLITGEVSDS